MSALGQKQTCAVHQPMSALPPIATLIAFFGMSAYHSPQSGHGLSDRDGSHVRVDGRVDLVRAVCGRADPFGN
jgi:hypothetical protein